MLIYKMLVQTKKTQTHLLGRYLISFPKHYGGVCVCARTRMQACMGMKRQEQKTTAGEILWTVQTEIHLAYFSTEYGSFLLSLYP